MEKSVSRIIFLLTLLVLASCSVQKRVYMKGYYVDWHEAHPKNNSIKTNHEAPYFIAGKNNLSLYQEQNEDLEPKLVASNSKTLFEKSNYKKTSNTIPISTAKSGYSKNDFKTNTKHNTTTFSKKLKDNGFLLFTGSLLGLLSFGLFKRNYSKSKQLAYWAKNNQKKTIAIIAVLKTFLGVIGLFFGKALYENNITASSDTTTNTLLGLSLLAAIFYPMKKSVSEFFKYRFTRKKIMHFILTISGFLLMVSIGNRVAENKNYSPAISSFFQTISEKTSTTRSVGIIASAPDSSLIVHTENPEDPASRTSWQITWRILLTIFLSLVTLALVLFLAILSCSLSCEGQEGLAILVLVGAAFSIWLFVYSLVALWKRRANNMGEQTKT